MRSAGPPFLARLLTALRRVGYTDFALHAPFGTSAHFWGAKDRAFTDPNAVPAGSKLAVGTPASAVVDPRVWEAGFVSDDPRLRRVIGTPSLD